MARPLAESLAQRFDRFLFAPADARAATMMRVALAAMIAWSFWSVGLRSAPPLRDLADVAIWFDRVFLTYGYAIAVTLLALLFGAGWRPRLTGLVLCVMLIPLASLSRGQQSRQVLIFTLLAFSFVKSDARWSVCKAASGESAGPMWPVRLMQIQLTIVYAMNAFAKSTRAYLSGDVLVGMSHMRSNFLVDLFDGHVHLGPLSFPVALAAVASVVIETWLAIGFWFPRLRWLTAAIGVAFHLMLQQIVHIFMLDFVSMFLYLAFLLPWRRGGMVRSDPQPVRV